jgi:hypothetical protein
MIVLSTYWETQILNICDDYPFTLRSRGLLPRMLLELALFLVHQPIYLDFTFELSHRQGPSRVGTKDFGTSTYSFNVFLVLLVTAKLLYFTVHKNLPRLLSRLNPNLFLQLTSLKEFPPITPRFYFQLAMLNRPRAMVGAMAGACLVTLAVMIQLAERPAGMLMNPKSHLSGQFNNYLDSLWHVVSSLTHLGYGDVIPQTYLGRFISLLAIFSGIFLV